ncbi:hypothetical protein [Desulfatiglans anilini]|uniref:hypothetical protein n=1 Tax=Desulfatiglans anilini TaxID=90728 RepID=UPI0004217D84|nr:hypothetical protein [Desulfatiglans anilini]
MMKKTVLASALTALLFIAAPAWAEVPASLSITGAVKSPLNLSLDDLAHYQSVEVQFNDVFEDGTYRGAFLYRGVPLKALLETSGIHKGDTDFNKNVDLAIVVKNKAGKQVALSWGEVFYKNPGRVVVGLSAQPIMPRKDCTLCHAPEVYKPRLDQLSRTIGFPKLIMGGDEYADRSLEAITSIEVVDLKPVVPAKKMEKLFSPEFVITGAVKNPVTVTELADHPRRSLKTRHLGEGRGFHGLDRVEGVQFRTVLDQAGLTRDLNTVFLISAPDGYRSLFSYGEVFLDPAGERMIIADHRNGEPLDKDGKFMFVPPDDLMADRDIKAVEKIQVISLGSAEQNK